MQGYRISDHFAQRMKSTILKVDRLPDLSAGGVIPVRFEEPIATRGRRAHRLCKAPPYGFPKGTIETLEVWEDGEPPNETRNADGETVPDVVNKYADIAADKWVSVALHGNGRWYVVSAEC